ncbi:MAG: hypothetical protein EZS28_004507 [Streblomastix strix]|uniref:Fido domain-containing protein n=1 Tax=Streblomastix strix TaxID=222440 RepID=A0A5J4WY12_9EUKA|nr:MAG: hypothetical protein EZS28_004507 [Streblomastix strix]
MTLDTDQMVTGYKQFTQSVQADQFIKTNGTDNQLLLANGDITDVGDFLPKHYPHAMEQMIIEPDNDIRNQGLRIMKNKANWDSFVLTGCNNDPTDSDGVWKMGSTLSQFMVQKQQDYAYDYKGLVIDFDCTQLKFNNQLVSPLPTPPIENAIKSTIAYGMYESLAWGSFTTYNGRAYISLQITHNNPNTQTQSTYTLFSVFKDEAKPQFTSTPFTIPLNAVMFAQKVLGYPICWNGAIPIDCYIDVDGHVRINTLYAAYLKQCIMNSNFIEQGFIPNETVNEAIQYIFDKTYPNIDEVYRLIFPKMQHVHRQCSVYVSGKNNSKIISADNVGIRHELIDPLYLQELVNKAHQTNDPVTKFKYFLIYQRVHPHEDSNGRIGRLLFLEIYNIPLSTTLSTLHQLRGLIIFVNCFNTIALTLDQQQINGYSQDIGQLQADVQVINTELARQTHFRGYFTTNDEILQLSNPAIGDYAYSAEDLLEWDYDGSQWIETDKLVPDQMTPASDANPLSDGTVNAGTSAEYSRGEHIHPLNISTSVPISETADGSVGASVNYTRSDHSHAINISSEVPIQDGDGSICTANSYTISDHQHVINVETNASNIPIFDGVGINGSSTFYARHDHVHSQQLTYDGNVTATKFIKTGGLASEVLCANGDTTTIDSKLSRSYNSSAGGWIRLCVFPAGASVGSPFIEFKKYSMYNAVQTIRLVPYYTVN